MAVRTDLFVLADHETAMRTSGGLDLAKGSSACQAARGSNGVGSEAIGADRAAETF